MPSRHIIAGFGGEVNAVSQRRQPHQFDLACAFETVYFWPGPVESFREVFRILGPEGTFLIVNESDGLNKVDRKWLALIDGLAIYTEEELVRFLEEAGFSEAEADRAPKKHWLCLKARK